MTTHLTESQINDFVDETLAHADLQWALQHVANCAHCRDEVAGMRSMLQRVAQLPLSIEPSRDFRRDVWTKVDSRTRWARRSYLSAAAMVLIALSSAITVLVMRSSEGPVVRIAETGRPAAIDLVSMERQYSEEVQELQRTLRTNRASLAPETVRILEENLRIIDAAIQEARAALAQDPASATLGELLQSVYRQKVELLKQATRSSAAT